MLGTLFGILLGGSAGWGLQRFLEHKLLPQARPSDLPIYKEPSPEDEAVWLMPKDYGLNKVFSDEKALRCVLNPETVTAHLADNNGSVKLFDDRFSADSVIIEKSNLPFLKQVWEAPNSYRPVSSSSSMFNPDVFLEFKNGGDTLKVILRFGCQDMQWVLNDHEDNTGGMGLTEYALAVLKAVLRQSFPESPTFLSPAIK